MAKDLVNYLERNDFETSGIVADANEKEAKIFIGVKTETLGKNTTNVRTSYEKEFEKNLEEFKKAHPRSRIIIKRKDICRSPEKP